MKRLLLLSIVVSDLILGTDMDLKARSTVFEGDGESLKPLFRDPITGHHLPVQLIVAAQDKSGHQNLGTEGLEKCLVHSS